MHRWWCKDKRVVYYLHIYIYIYHQILLFTIQTTCFAYSSHFVCINMKQSPFLFRLPGFWTIRLITAAAVTKSRGFFCWTFLILRYSMNCLASQESSSGSSVSGAIKLISKEQRSRDLHFSDGIVTSLDELLLTNGVSQWSNLLTLTLRELNIMMHKYNTSVILLLIFYTAISHWRSFLLRAELTRLPRFYDSFRPPFLRASFS